MNRLEHFQAGWNHPATRKMRQIKNLEPLRVSLKPAKALVITAAFCLLAAPAFAGAPDPAPQAPVPAAAPGDNAVIDVASRIADAAPHDLTAGLSVPVTLKQPQVPDDAPILAQADTTSH